MRVGKRSYFREVSVSIGEIWWYGDGDDVANLSLKLDGLSNAGLRVENPGTGERYYLDEGGKQALWNFEVFSREWLNGQSVTAQYWISSEADVLVSAERDRGLIIVDLDGLSYVEARRTVFAVVDAASTITGTRAVVVERNLPDSGDFWNSFVDEGRESAVLPEVDLLMTAEESGGSYSLTIGSSSWLMVHQY